MSTKILASTALVLGVLTADVRAADISWWAFIGGGGLSQHGSIELGGAIGPIAPALSPATGGNYTLSGGFWPALSGQPQPASPLLKITSFGNGEKVRLSWPVNLNGFKLEYTTDLGSGVWQPENELVVDTITEHTVTVPAPGMLRCYRLRSE